MAPQREAAGRARVRAAGACARGPSEPNARCQPRAPSGLSYFRHLGKRNFLNQTILKKQPPRGINHHASRAGGARGTHGYGKPPAWALIPISLEMVYIRRNVSSSPSHKTRKPNFATRGQITVGFRQRSRCERSPGKTFCLESGRFQPRAPSGLGNFRHLENAIS